MAALQHRGNVAVKCGQNIGITRNGERDQLLENEKEIPPDTFYDRVTEVSAMRLVD